MSRLDNRIKSLVRKTHVFVSHEDFRVIRDYLTSALESMSKPPDFEARRLELEGLMQRYATATPETNRTIAELIASSDALNLQFWVFLSDWGLKLFPEGEWAPKIAGDLFLKLAEAAEEYFRSGRAGGRNGV